ncbi:MAG TPA: hypothetical protein VEF89_20035 [Solirubrobacteraceae bacterium]|nr:hypothetical protein [Solirubrobacteraceae bacterium]
MAQLRMIAPRLTAAQKKEVTLTPSVRIVGTVTLLGRSPSAQVIG